jgi:hypothetical protein
MRNLITGAQQICRMSGEAYARVKHFSLMKSGTYTPQHSPNTRKYGLNYTKVLGMVFEKAWGPYYYQLHEISCSQRCK